MYPVDERSRRQTVRFADNASPTVLLVLSARARRYRKSMGRYRGQQTHITVAQIAPAVRTAWGEALGLSREEATVGKIADALHKLGVDYVFDTSFSADLTIMEEGNEFLERFTKGETQSSSDVYFLLPGLDPIYQIAVSSLGTAAFHRQVSSADVWRR